MLNPVAYREQAEELRSSLTGIGDELTEAFRAVTQAPYVSRIDVFFGESGPVSLDLVLTLVNGRKCFPQQLFSEGYRDLLALLFFTTVAKEAAKRGQARILILDDVLQSVDSSVRRAAVEYLLTTFKRWQFIFTVHDRLWLKTTFELSAAAREST